MVLSGTSSGLESSVYAIICICLALGVGIWLGDGNIQFTFYMVALTGMGMLATTGVIVSEDTFGPVADNAAGIAEMSGEFEGEPERIMVSLDAVGNTTKAVTKGFAIGSAVIASVALFASYVETIGGELDPLKGLTGNALFNNFLTQINLANPKVFIGLLVGGSVSFLFSALAIRAVGRTAGVVVQEVRSQFADGGIMAGTKKPDYGPVIDICTAASLRELATPALLAVLTPLIIGFGINFYALGAFLAGVILTGQLMANYLSNAGGAWDNAKKYIEDGNEGGKGSEAHKAAVIGDTVGDPFKDTAGPGAEPADQGDEPGLAAGAAGDDQPAQRRRPLRHRRRLPARADRRRALLEAQERRLRRGVRDRRRGHGRARPPRRRLRRRIARFQTQVASPGARISRSSDATSRRVRRRGSTAPNQRSEPLATVPQVGHGCGEHGVAEVADRVPPRAVADVRRRAGVVFDAVVLDHDPPRPDTRDRPGRRIRRRPSRTTNWCDGRR